MENCPLFQRESTRRQTALRILAELQLLERWQIYGRPYLVGAVSYGLVVAPDLDIEVYCQGTPRIEEGFAVMAACAQHPGIRQVKFSNHLQDEDQGLYWQLQYLHEDGVKWKVDLWSMCEDYPGPASRDLVEPMQHCLTGETRAAILEIKEQMLAQPDLHSPSIFVYQAVMQGGVRSMTAFLDWRTHNPQAGLVNWKPA